MKAMRYENLVHEINRVKPKRIVEIGTCKGERAEMMIRAAVQHRDDVEYIGFDLFEAPPDEEFSARTHPWPVSKVQQRLEHLGAQIWLVVGDTKGTLHGFSDVDFVFLDGGHSDETVRSDFEAILPAINPGAPIMCDDYWNYPGGGGCNALVDSLDCDKFDVTLLDPIDEFNKPYGVLRTRIARVVAK